MACITNWQHHQGQPATSGAQAARMRGGTTSSWSATAGQERRKDPAASLGTTLPSWPKHPLPMGAHLAEAQLLGTSWNRGRTVASPAGPCQLGLLLGAPVWPGTPKKVAVGQGGVLHDPCTGCACGTRGGGTRGWPLVKCRRRVARCCGGTPPPPEFAVF